MFGDLAKQKWYNFLKENQLFSFAGYSYYLPLASHVGYAVEAGFSPFYGGGYAAFDASGQGLFPRNVDGSLVFGLIVTRVCINVCGCSSKSYVLSLAEAGRSFKDLYPLDVMFLKLIKSSLSKKVKPPLIISISTSSLS